MRRSTCSLALSLAALLALAGCGTTGVAGTLVTTPISAQAGAQLAAAGLPAPTVGLADAPGVTLVPGAATATRTAGIRVVSTEDISDAELQADAKAADGSSSYQLQDVSVPSVTGYVRRGDTATYLLEAGTNEYGAKIATTYALTCADMTVYNFLGEHVNKRVMVRGLFAANHVVTVTYANGATDLSFLTNWWTKGKLKGQAIASSGLPLVNAQIKARSAQGFVFLTDTDDTGHFAIGNLEPGWYQIWFSKQGYGTQSTMVTLRSHKATTLEGVL